MLTTIPEKAAPQKDCNLSGKSVLDLLTEEGVIREGHFLLTSGKHSNIFVDKDRIFRSSLFPMIIEKLTSACSLLTMESVSVITGPAVAGAILAAPVYYKSQQTYGKHIHFVYPEKEGEKMVFRRGYDLFLANERVVIIEDVITTGKSVTKTVDAIHACSGTVQGVVCIWNRTGWQSKDFPTIALINKKVDCWEQSVCPLCKEMPVTNPKE